jgi:predicted RNA binding protein YcfA (HicA-like mRNA interferase family)
MPRIVPLDSDLLAAVFRKAGYEVSRISGDHIIMAKKGSPRPLVIPKKKSVPVFVILNNLRIAGISRDEYLRLLQA